MGWEVPILVCHSPILQELQFQAHQVWASAPGTNNWSQKINSN